MPQTDVLIVGSGSAGIFAATWLAIYGVPFTMIERRAGPLEMGQADGVQCRTVEIYESFGLAAELLREAYHIYEVCFWGVDASGTLVRKSRAVDTKPGLSHLPHVILNQARMNALMLGKMEGVLKERGEWVEGAPNGVEYGWTVSGVEVDESKALDQDAYCVRVTAEKDGEEEVWDAKYVLGCDGAHSTVRKALGHTMIGDTTDTVWGVMDIYPLTNFPDIRRKCTLHSRAGNLLIIPREGGSLARLYIQLPAGSSPKAVTLPNLQSTARAIFAPYTLSFASTSWWSAYSIGQRLASSFHTAARVFLTGDACHTHSPKAGQGMNVSLQDGFNLGWKLGCVLRGLAPREVLDTYVAERAQTAADLIAFDRELARMFSREEQRPGEFAAYFTKSARYTAGLTARYGASVLTAGDAGDAAAAAAEVVVGMRFPSRQVVRFCDCRPLQLLSVLRSDGRWRVVVFAGDVREGRVRGRLEELSTHLAALTARYTPPGGAADSAIEALVVLSTPFAEAEMDQVPAFFTPVNGPWGMRDLHKIFVDDAHYNAGHGHAYEGYGVSSSGAVVVVRPDQYVSKVTRMDDFEGLSGFFAGCLVEQREEGDGGGNGETV